MDLNRLMADELRGGWLDVPRAYTPLDLFGAALGGFMAYMGWRDRDSWQGVTALGLGSVMIWIHLQRFFYAPQSADGLARLALALDLSRTDLAKVATLLPPDNTSTLTLPPPSM